MNSKDFTAYALRTESRPATLCLGLNSTVQVLHFLVAAANVADAIKRGIYYGKGLDAERMNTALADAALTLDVLFDTGLENLATPDVGLGTLTQPNLRLLHGALGIFGESGEMLEALVNQANTGELDLVNFVEETGDTDWYKAIIHDETGVSEETTRSTVIAKLQKRYPGKFTNDGANERDLSAEREAMVETLAETASGRECVLHK